MVDKLNIVATVSVVVLLFSQQSLGKLCDCSCEKHSDNFRYRKNVCDELETLNNKVILYDHEIQGEWVPVKPFVQDLKDNFETKVQNVVSGMKSMLSKPPSGELRLDFSHTIHENLFNLTNRMSQLERKAANTESLLQYVLKELIEEKNARNKLEEGLVEEQNSRVKLEGILKEEQTSRKALEKELAEEKIERRELEEIVSEEKKVVKTLADGLVREQNERIVLQRELLEARLRLEKQEATLSREQDGRKILERLLLEGQNKTEILEAILREAKAKIRSLEMRLEADKNEIIKLKDGLGTNKKSMQHIYNLLLEDKNKIETLAQELEKELNKIIKLEEKLIVVGKLNVEQNEAEKMEKRLVHLENVLSRELNGRSMLEEKVLEEQNRIKIIEEGIEKEQKNIKQIKKFLQEEQSKRQNLEQELLNEKTGRETLEQSFKEEQTKREKLEKGLVIERNGRKILQDNLNETRSTMISFGNQIVQFSASAEEIISMLPKDFEFFRNSLSTELKVFSQQLNIDTDNLLRNTKYSIYGKVTPPENSEIHPRDFSTPPTRRRTRLTSFRNG